VQATFITEIMEICPCKCQGQAGMQIISVSISLTWSTLPRVQSMSNVHGLSTKETKVKFIVFRLLAQSLEVCKVWPRSLCSAVNQTSENGPLA